MAAWWRVRREKRRALLASMLTTTDAPAAWIRSERTRLGMTTRDLACLAGVAFLTISRIENGHTQPRWSTLEKIFVVIGRPVAPLPDRLCLADLSEAWFEDHTGMQHPDWVRLRAFADQLQLHPELITQAILPEPPRSRSALMDVLLAGIAEKVADDAGIARPHWVRNRPPLAEPWVAAARPSKRAEASATAPDQFVRRGLLIPQSAIWRERTLVLASERKPL
jgi:transcriptional regulator with XRE-family HTH domain